MAYNYVTKFERTIDEVYRKGLLSADLSSQNDKAKFIDTKTIKIPSLSVGGYKEHGRMGGWNRQEIKNTYQSKELTHDRDVEFFVDQMDVDETNQLLTAANVTNTFLREQSIPELDSYRFSKLYTEFATTYGKTPVTEALTAANILDAIDDMFMRMNEAEVPEEGRVLYVTPTVERVLKTAAGISRSLGVQSNNGVIDRRVSVLDNVRLQVIPSARMKTIYDFSDGFKPGVGAKQMNMILLHPSAVIAPIKHSAIYLFAPGEHTNGDGWLYQNRMYTDLFLYEKRVDAVQIHVEAQAGGGE